MEKRADFILDQMAWWIMGILVLVIVIGGYIALKGKGENAVAYIKNIFNFGEIGIKLVFCN